MINKINKLLRQEQGFTLMELMIVVVILGILAGIAVPVYNNVQDTARQNVGDANASMLNRGIRTWEALGEAPYSDEDGYSDEHEDALLEWLKLDEVQYVTIMDDPEPEANKWYEADSDADAVIPASDPDTEPE